MNGQRVNGERQLHHYDLIQVGPLEFHFLDPDHAVVHGRTPQSATEVGTSPILEPTTDMNPVTPEFDPALSDSAAVASISEVIPDKKP